LGSISDENVNGPYFFSEKNTADISVQLVQVFINGRRGFFG
jgi:hypothetical protein